MNVAFVTTALRLGGTEAWVCKAATALHRRGHICRVVTKTRSGPRLARLERAGVEVVGLPDLQSSLAVWLRTNQPDVVDLNVWEDQVATIRSAGSVGLPVVVSVHHASSHRIPGLVWRLALVGRHGLRTEQWIRAVRSSVDGCVVCSEQARFDTLRLLGKTWEDRVTTVYACALVSPLPVVSAEVMAGPARLLQVGALIPLKAPEATLSAFEVLRAESSEASLVYVGDGELANDLRRRVAEREIEGVTFAGAQDDVTSFYLNANMLVLPSRSEGLPLVVTEAASCGLPVIASDVGGISELVRHRFNGLLVPPGDAPALLAAVRELAHDRSLRAALGENARKSVAEGFLMSQAADSLLNAYEKAVRHRARARTSTGGYRHHGRVK